MLENIKTNEVIKHRQRTSPLTNRELMENYGQQVNDATAYSLSDDTLSEMILSHANEQAGFMGAMQKFLRE